MTVTCQLAAVFLLLAQG
ncbi:hypothetical protein D046_7589A, partial [Vibrio parahaemolyticus V-223/04]